MRIEEVFAAKNNVLYVILEDGTLLKYDMSDKIDADPDLFELKYYPEKFVTARVTNEGRTISWGDDASISGKLIEEEGSPVDIGFLELTSTKQLEELKENSDEPIVNRALDNYYGGLIFLELHDFAELYEWISDRTVMYLGANYEDTEWSSMYESMLYNMEWLSDRVDWWEYYRHMNISPEVDDRDQWQMGYVIMMKPPEPLEEEARALGEEYFSQFSEEVMYREMSEEETAAFHDDFRRGASVLDEREPVRRKAVRHRAWMVHRRGRQRSERHRRHYMTFHSRSSLRILSG